MAAAIHVLYVDDESALLEIGKQFLEQSGDFTITTAISAPDAIRLLEQESFDIIVSDYQMPEIDGIEFLVLVRTRFGKIPFILFTGKGREEVVIAALNAGADGYLQKGSDPKSQFAELSHKITQAVSRKMAEDSLRKSEQRYRGLFENMLEGFAYCRMLYDESGRPTDFTYLNVNPAFNRIVGTSVVVGKPATEVFPGIKEALPELFEIYGRVVSTGEPESFALDFIPLKKWLHISVYSPAKEHFVAIFEDITEHKRTGDALTESFAIFKTVMDGLDALVYVADMKTYEILFINQYGRKIWGDLTGKICWESLQMDQKDPCQFCTNEKLLDLEGNPAGILIWEFQNTITGQWYECHDSAIRWTDGRIVRIEIASDITTRKKVEAALLASESRYRTLAESSTDNIFIIGRDDTIQFVNSSAARTLHFPIDEIIGKPRKNFFFSDIADIQGNHLRKVLETGEPSRGEGKHLYGNKEFWQDTTLVPLKDEAGNITAVLGVGRDITERKRAELELDSALESLKEAHHLAHIGTWDWVKENDIVIWSEELYHILGRDPSQPALTYAEHPRIYTPASWDSLNCAVTRALTTGEPYNLELELVRQDGSIRWINAFGGVKRDADGKVIGLHGTLQDITERKRADAVLQESEEKYRTLFSGMPSGVAIYEAVDDGEDFVFRDFNTAGETIEQIRKEEVIGRRVTEVFPGVKEFGVFFVFQRVWRTGKPEFFPTDIYRDARDPGTWRESWVYKLPTGEIVSIYNDVTERKRAEDALQKSEEKYRQLVELAEEGIWAIDAENNTTYLNPRMAEMLQYTVDEMQGLPILSFMDDAGKMIFAQNMERRRQGITEVLPFEFITKGGSRIYVTISASALTDDTGTYQGSIAVISDIIFRKKAEETIRLALAEKEVLLREIHHRVKNNLAGILALIELQISSLSDPAVVSLLKDMETRIRSMALVHESLYLTEDLARINVATYTETLTRHLFEVYRTATEVRCTIDMGDVTMSIETAIPCGLVMNEIVTNSLKYAFPDTFSCGEIRGEPSTITLTLHREGSDYLLKIADNGIGIPEGIDVTMAHSLGLFLIRFIVEHQLRGSLEISTTGGTAYTIRFPEPAVKECHSDE